jgi:hypothetical protein
MLTLKIEQDNDRCNSPDEWDEFGHIVIKHNREFEPDSAVCKDDPYDYILQQVVDTYRLERIEYVYDKNSGRIHDRYKNQYGIGLKDNMQSLTSWYSEQREKEFDKTGAVIVSIYMYSHSGIRLSTSTFNDRWDSGQLGYIYATKEEIDKVFGGDKEKAAECLKGTIDTWDQYVSGDVWYVSIENEDGEIIESCGGYYGRKYAEEEGNSLLASCQKTADKERAEAAARADEELREALSV